MRRAHWSAAALLVAMAGCVHNVAGPPGPGSSRRTLDVDGVDRDYILHLGKGYDSARAVPLVILLHGYGGEGAELERGSHMSDLADSAGFIVAYPNGTSSIVRRRRWSTGPNSHDRLFISLLLDTLQRRFNIDPSRIYVGGFSNGGGMAYWLGATIGDRLAAIGVASGTIGRVLHDGRSHTVPAPRWPISVVAFHGIEDDVIPYDQEHADGSSEQDAVFVPESIAFWRDRDGCPKKPVVDSLADGRVVRQRYAPCGDSTDVELYTMLYAQHAWTQTTTMGTDGQPVGLDITHAMWEFFRRHSRR